MRKLKPSPKVLENLVDRDARQTKVLAGIQPIVTGYDSEFWAEVVRRIMIRVERIRLDRETRFHAMTELELKVSKAREDELIEVTAMPKNIISAAGALGAENVKLKQMIREKRKELKAVGNAHGDGT
jgi:hypothetical protein